jgi:hypothetical protein
MELITIHTAFNPADAQLVRSRLDAAGFHPMVKNEIAAMVFEGYTMGVGGIQVQVPEDEASEAREFLESPGE